MGKINANIMNIGELNFSLFDIPFYQRPYRWQTIHVDTLLNTLRDNLKKEEYRIGSIIVNPNSHSGKFDIVDGQQRLTTLSLIFMCLEGSSTSHRLQCTYSHIDSRLNIYRNYHHIQNWLSNNNIQKKQLLDIILNKCSVVVITADDLTEAFQMFDSQNGRGKELEAYNLLKAYHLRAIDNDTTTITLTEEKKDIDRQWESAVLMKGVDSEESLLKTMVNNLYRIRKWSRQHSAWSFGKSKINEFKGIQFNKGEAELPLTNISLLLYLHYNTQTESINHRGIDDKGQNPFVSITMDIINGNLFFEYIRTYINAYNYVILNPKPEGHPLYKFQQDFKEYCLQYPGAKRKGDGYIREVFIALVLALYDRFGEVFVNRYYKTLYSLAYRERLRLQRVCYASTIDFPKRYFECITTSVNDSGLRSLIEFASQSIDYRANNIKVAEFILNSGGIINKNGKTINSDDLISD
jgi:hypothetical protein